MRQVKRLRVSASSSSSSSSAGRHDVFRGIGFEIVIRIVDFLSPFASAATCKLLEEASVESDRRWCRRVAEEARQAADSGQHLMVLGRDEIHRNPAFRPGRQVFITASLSTTQSCFAASVCPCQHVSSGLPALAVQHEDRWSARLCTMAPDLAQAVLRHLHYSGHGHLFVICVYEIDCNRRPEDDHLDHSNTFVSFVSAFRQTHLVHWDGDMGEFASESPCTSRVSRSTEPDRRGSRVWRRTLAAATAQSSYDCGSPWVAHAFLPPPQRDQAWDTRDDEFLMGGEWFHREPRKCMGCTPPAVRATTPPPPDPSGSAALTVSAPSASLVMSSAGPDVQNGEDADTDESASGDEGQDIDDEDACTCPRVSLAATFDEFAVANPDSVSKLQQWLTAARESR